FHLHQAPLQTDPTATATAINTWFAQQTNGHIERAVTTEDVAAPTDLVGVTVTASVSPWKETYSSLSETRPRPFTFAPDSKADVSMMSTTWTLPYLENEYLQMVRLDYTSTGMSLLVLVPKKELGLAEALTTLTPESFTQALTS